MLIRRTQYKAPRRRRTWPLVAAGAGVLALLLGLMLAFSGGSAPTSNSSTKSKEVASVSQTERTDARPTSRRTNPLRTQKDPETKKEIEHKKDPETKKEIEDKKDPEPEPLKTIENSLHMKLVRIPAGEFTMGSSPEEGKRLGVRADDLAAEGPPHPVKITKPFFMSCHPVTLKQFFDFLGVSGYQPIFKRKQVERIPYRQTNESPVVIVSWEDAVAFCDWLSKKEGKKYRLPTEAEWEYACRAGRDTAYGFGDDPAMLGKRAWFKENSGNQAHPVGTRPPNRWGLSDMHGNVYQWTADWYAPDYYKNSPQQDPLGPGPAPTAGQKKPLKVMRGGDYTSDAAVCRSAARKYGSADDYATPRTGFRVVLEEPTRDPMPLQTIDNAIRMKLVRIPPGEFTMGSSPEERKRYAVQADAVAVEGPQHPVRITKRFSMAVHLVTVGQFRQFVQEAGYRPEGGDQWQNPFKRADFKPADDHPVVSVTWNDAVAFCRWLSKKDGHTHRLPTDAEWEYCCRAGKQTPFHFGENAEQLPKYAWFGGNADGHTHPVTGKTPNAWSLYDMGGHAWQWVEDWYDADYYKNSPDKDPHGPASGRDKVMRGGSIFTPGWACRAASRKARPANYVMPHAGFRVVRED
jgi:formylglycine-generating enzyme required for sulfatase activity